MNRKKIIAVALAAALAVSGLAYGMSRKKTSVNAMTSDEAKQLVASVLPNHVSHVGTDEDDQYATFEYYDESGKTLYEVRVNLRKGEIENLREFPMYQELVPVNSRDDDRDDEPKQSETEGSYDYSRVVITREDAIAIALKAVPGASKKHVREVELDDRDDRKPEYEVEIVFDGVKYEFEIHARTGAILEKDVDKTNSDRGNRDDDDRYDDRTNNSTSSSYISAERAMEIALSRVDGATKDHIREFEFDDDDHDRDDRPEYEGKIVYNGVEYEFEIDARNGNITAWERESLDDDDDDDRDRNKGTQTTTVATTQNYIGRDRAIQIALALVPGSTTAHLEEVEFDWDDGRPEWEIEIEFNGYDYDIEIDARNENIVKFEKDRDDDDDDRDRQPKATTAAPTVAPTTAAPTTPPTTVAPTTPPTTAAPTQGQISRDQAIKIALAKVPGATASHIEEIELDWDDGRPEWEIEIEYNGYEYEIEIDGRNGNILEFDKERDD